MKKTIKSSRNSIQIKKINYLTRTKNLSFYNGQFKARYTRRLQIEVVTKRYRLAVRAINIYLRNKQRVIQIERDLVRLDL